METWCEAIEQYDEWLDGIHGDFMGRYPASRVLREVDPVAYRCGLYDFIDIEGIDSDDLTGDLSV